MNNLEVFQGKKKELGGLLEATKALFSAINEDSEVKTLEELQEKLRNDNFKVLVIGEFKRGKSTFINALMHEEILPAYSVPCTAIINEIKYGENKKAIIYFKQKIENMPEGLAAEIKEYIAKYNGKGKIPPLTVDFDKLEEYVTITDVEKEQAESISESPFERAEIYVPLDLCRDGVEIIDSPGLNEHGTRDAVTTKYSRNVDAIIFVLLCQPMASGSELKSISDLRALGHEDIFFVCNSFDLIREKERPRVIQMAQTRLGTQTKLGDRGLHFVSSLEALEARTEELDGDKIKAREEASNFPKMEAALSDFLINDRGRIKLGLPSKTIAQKLTENLPKKIEQKIKNLDAQSGELKQRVAESKEKVADLKHREEANMGNLMGKVSFIEQLIEKETQAFICEIAAKVPDWINECEPSAGLGVIFTTKADIENVSHELVDYATEKIKEAQEVWRKEQLEPRIKTEIDEFKHLAEGYVAEFKKKMGEAEGDLTGEESEYGSGDIDAFYIDNGIDQTIFADLIATAAPTVAVGICMGFLSFLSPWLLIPALLGTGGISRLLNKESKMANIKSSVGQEMAKQIQLDGFNKLKTTPATLSDRLKEIIEKFKSVFDREINGAQARADQALADSTLNDQEVEDRKKQYAEILERAQGLAKQNETFLSAL